MREYVEIGEDQMQDFYVNWEDRFAVSAEEALERI